MEGSRPPPNTTLARGVPDTTQETFLATPSSAHPTDPELTFLTLNAQKAGANSPSLTDIVTVSDLFTLDFLLLVETPLYQHSGTPTHALRNRGYSSHYHPSNAPFQTDVLPEARLPTHLTHSGEGCWPAYRKYSSWSSMVQPLILSADCPLWN
jgi:hypothetical protein